MLAILSPAKKLAFTPIAERQGAAARPALAASQPRFLADAQVLARIMKRQSAADLQSLMGISEKLATLNVERFQSFHTPLTEGNAAHAALTFAGDTYVGLDASSLSDADLNWAQDHLRILSGLYGVLAPLDLMQPYRLEMGSAVKSRRGANLYHFWGEKLARHLNTLVRGHEDARIVNLASNEYSSAVPKKVVRKGWITPQFREMRNGKPKVISFTAKRMRGAMARFMIKQRVDRAEGLKDFQALGYRFDAAGSSADEWLWLKPESAS